MNKLSKRVYGCLATSAGVAEPDFSASNLAEGPGVLTVHAPHVLRRPSDRKNEELVCISHRVSYAGLDLAMHADVLELRRRMVESAQTGCEP